MPPLSSAQAERNYCNGVSLDSCILVNGIKWCTSNEHCIDIAQLPPIKEQFEDISNNNSILKNHILIFLLLIIAGIFIAKKTIL